LLGLGIVIGVVWLLGKMSEWISGEEGTDLVDTYVNGCRMGIILGLGSIGIVLLYCIGKEIVNCLI
jgi:hypothetical protein